MNLSKTFGLVSLIFIASIGAASADHGSQNPAGHLRGETQELNSVVQRSWLNYNVKSAVQRFAMQANRAAANCGGGFGGNFAEATEQLIADHAGEITNPLDHNEGNCGYEAQTLRNVWSEVERYLYDTTYDFPQVYSQYVETRQALYDFLAIAR